jgi:hypothetical protein
VREQGGDDIRRRHAAIALRHQHRHHPRSQFLWPGHHAKSARAGIVEAFRSLGRAAVRIDHHAGGMLTRHAPHCQLWVIGHYRTDAHHHRVHRRAQRVQVIERIGAVDPPAVARQSGDPAVQRLAKLCHDHWRAEWRATDLGQALRRNIGQWKTASGFVSSSECIERLERGVARHRQLPVCESEFGGPGRNRTGIDGFAIRYITTLSPDHRTRRLV